MATMKAGGPPETGVKCCEISLCIPPCPPGEACTSCDKTIIHRACGRACELIKPGDTVKLPTGEEGSVMSVSTAIYGESSLEVL